MIVELTGDNGCRGLGELSDIEEAWAMPAAAEVGSLLKRLLVGKDVADRRRVHLAVSKAFPQEWHHELRRMLSSAVDMALADLAGRLLGVPLYELLGGIYRRRVPVSWVAFIRETRFLEQEVAEKVREGFQAFKLKVGEDFEADCEHVRAIRRVAGPDVYLKVDASGSWDVDEAISRIGRLSQLGVDAVETPVRAAARELAKDNPDAVNHNVDDVARALAAVRQAVPVPILEHVVDFSDAFALALAKHQAVDAFNVAVSQAGSLARAQRLIHVAEAAGLDVLLGSTVELGPGTAAALHIAAACQAVNAPSDLVGPGLLQDDVITSPFLYDRRGRLEVPTGPGLGVDLDPAKLNRYRRE